MSSPLMFAALGSGSIRSRPSAMLEML
jgi:hypothetical protein